MSDLTIVIGNKNYSSWSMRPWLALKKTGQPFREEPIALRLPDTKQHILAHSGAGKVPVLKHGAILVWESLAICEYLAETFPAAHLWPGDKAARAHARAISSEMHAGFEALRKNTESSGIAKADSSIWEVHDENKKHFAYTTLATIRGFCDFAQLATKAGKGSDATTYRGLASKARDGFLQSFVDREGAIAGSVEELAQNQYLDGAVVEAFTWNVLKDSEYVGRTGKATLDVLGRLRVESGGFKRNDDGKSSYDNNEWIMIDLRMADALWRAGRESESAGLTQMIIDKASANYYLLPELYNAVRADGAVGKYIGDRKSVV